jgi:hypothetical protein
MERDDKELRHILTATLDVAERMNDTKETGCQCQDNFGYVAGLFGK